MPRTHKDCWQQNFPRVFTPLGSIRRCEHGKVQVLTEPPPGAKWQGPGTWWWRTLHPFWNRRLYRRAVAALEAAK
ncbi:hypothetical protein ACMX2H_15995 [Arthrobacter sulfonylureivorans]|uniref:hypothetical protein n=1 Tax=Arthrobacter sulfonylureivorans TaxID=2486855 RepID=UPI0039E2F2EA